MHYCYHLLASVRAPPGRYRLVRPPSSEQYIASNNCQFEILILHYYSCHHTKYRSGAGQRGPAESSVCQKQFNKVFHLLLPDHLFGHIRSRAGQHRPTVGLALCSLGSSQTYRQPTLSQLTATTQYSPGIIYPVLSRIFFKKISFLVK